MQDGSRKLDSEGQPIGWTGYTWNKNYFPDPKVFLSWANGKGLKICLNLHPASGIQPHESCYKEFAKEIAPSESNSSTQKPFKFDIVNKKWAEAYFKCVIHPMENEGVNF